MGDIGKGRMQFFRYWNVQWCCILEISCEKQMWEILLSTEEPRRARATYGVFRRKGCPNIGSSHLFRCQLSFALCFVAPKARFWREMYRWYRKTHLLAQWAVRIAYLAKSCNKVTKRHTERDICCIIWHIDISTKFACSCIWEYLSLYQVLLPLRSVFVFLHACFCI